MNRACFIGRDCFAIPGLDGQKAVLYRSKMNPRLGRNFEAMDPLEWLARMADHIPDTGKHHTPFYGFYASRVRASRRETEASGLPTEPAPAKRRCPPSWARLIRKVCHADPLVCLHPGAPRAYAGHRPSMLDLLIPRSFVARFAKSGSVAVLALGLIAAGAVAAAPLKNQDEKPGAALVERGIPLTAQARKQILQWVLAHPGVTQQARGHRLAGIRVTAGSTTDASSETKTIVTVVLFDHTALEARRVAIDTVSGELLANVRLPGRPQSSREEFEEAVEIVRRDPDLAGLLDQGGVLDGGFIVDDPAGSRRRMIQLKLLSTDRLTLLRSITVDLTRRVIASE